MIFCYSSLYNTSNYSPHHSRMVTAALKQSSGLSKIGHISPKVSYVLFVRIWDTFKTYMGIWDIGNPLGGHECLFEPRSEKTGLRGFRPGPTQTMLYSHMRWLEA